MTLDELGSDKRATILAIAAKHNWQALEINNLLSTRSSL
jgi:hypothetical protein